MRALKRKPARAANSGELGTEGSVAEGHPIPGPSYSYQRCGGLFLATNSLHHRVNRDRVFFIRAAMVTSNLSKLSTELKATATRLEPK
jgi:hypothetical protein